MIRIATLQTAAECLPLKQLDKLVKELKRQQVDVLCCREEANTPEGRHDFARELAHSLEMTYTFSNITRERSKSGEASIASCTGLSILTGKNCWMLNSGSLVFCENGPQRRAQFGVIRKDNNSILVVNARFLSNDPPLKKQLANLLNLPLLNEQFGAIILFSNLEQNLATRHYKPQMDKTHLRALKVDAEETPAGAPSILTLRENPPTVIDICQGKNLPCRELEHACYIAEFTLTRIAKEKRRKRYTPLSFRERWLGSRDGDRVFAF